MLILPKISKKHSCQAVDHLPVAQKNVKLIGDEIMSILPKYRGHSCQAVDHLPMAQQNVKLTADQIMSILPKYQGHSF